MKVTKILAFGCVFFASSSYAVDPVKMDMTCEQLREKYAPTAEAQERFADLKGSCEGVYDINGAMYVRTTAVVRRKAGNRIYLYVPATDHTFSVIPEPDGRVWVGDRKVRPRDLKAGGELGIYLSVDKLAEQRVTSVAFATEDDHEQEIIEVPAEKAPALPTTG